MATEKRWLAVAPVLLTVNGGTDGKLTLASTRGFKVKQLVILKSTAPASTDYEVKFVESQTILYLGPKDGKIKSRADLSAFTTGLGATLEAVEQLRPSIPAIEHERAVYEEEPTVAKRALLVDLFGEDFNENNPLPTAAVGSAADKDWDDLVLTRDPDTQDLTTAEYKKNGNVVRTLSFVYDAYENLIEVIKS